MMDVPRQVQTVFLAAVEILDPVARARFLAETCPDAELRARVEALLRAHDQTAHTSGIPIVAAPGDDATRDHAAGAGDGSTRTGGTEAADPDENLAFLTPPGRPDSLGRISHYEVLEIRGRGGFGIVFRAFDEVLQRVVAVKVLAPQMAATSPARKRFLREARSSAAIRHDNVVQVHAVEEQPLPYLVMEFIPGETLQQLVEKTGPLDVPEVLRIGRQVAEGLAAAHAEGLIHRDVKPANILIDGGVQRRVKLTDFGLARAADDASISQSGVVAGTPMFMAPEQARGDTLDQRADLFSLGSVLYTMIAGHPPFRAGNIPATLKRVVEDTPRPLREVIPETPDWLCRIVEKLHAKDAASRFQTAREVADLLADCEAQLNAHGTLKDCSRIPGGEPRRRRPSRRAAWAAGLLLLVTGLGVWAGPWAWRYAHDRAEVEFAPADGWVSVIPVRGDTPVTDWIGVREKPAALTLAPGRYRFNPGFAPGRTVSRWEVVYRTPLSARTETLFELPFGGSFEIEVARGERVTIRAVMRDDPTTLPVVHPPAHERLQGRWRLVSAERKGKPVPVADLQSVDWIEFAGDTQKTYWRGKEWPGTFALNATAPLPEVNLLSPEYTPVLCLYKFDGDKLVMAQSLPGQPRPTGFTTTADTAFSVATYVREARPDRERLQGTWHVVGGEEKGVPVPVSRMSELPWYTFGLGRYRNEHQGKKYVGSFAIDPLQTPKRLDLTPDGFGTLPGIYELNGDDLRICFDDPGKPRPTAFTTSPDSQRVVVTLRRAVPPPMAAAPFDSAKAKQHQEAWAKHLGVEPAVANTLGMKLSLIPPGEFTMGNSDENPFAADGDKPQHRVTLTQPFFLGTHEVTVGQFKAFVEATKTKTYAETDPKGAQVALETGYEPKAGTNWRTPGFPQTDAHPVTCITWAEANAFCEWLSMKEGVTYRLPTDAEWEFACRAGTTSLYYYGTKADPTMAAMQRWNEDLKTVPVGSFPANPFGLHDMLGNVYEWMHDGRRKYAAEPVTDPVGPTGEKDERGRRGGAWSSALDQKIGAISGGRFAGPRDTEAAQTIGFRVVRVGDLKGKP